jgi:hypothetical protein
MMKKLLIALMLLLPATAHAQKTKTVLTTEVNTNLASGSNITAATLRGTLLDMINSYVDILAPSTATSLALGGATLGSNTLAVTGGILFQPAFQSANPANAAIFSSISNPANGYTSVNNGIQFSQGTVLGAAQQFGGGTVPIQQALVATLNIQAGDNAGIAGNAIAGYARTQSNGAGAVGVAGFGMCDIENGAPNGSQCWGANFGAANGPVFNGSTFIGFDTSFLAGVEIDLNLMKTVAGVDPTCGLCTGLDITGAGNITGPLGVGILINPLSVTSGAKWNFGFQTAAGAAVNAFVAGPVATGNSTASQPSVWQAVNSAGATLNSTILEDQVGNFFISSAAGAIVVLQDAVGNAALKASTTLGAGGVALPAMTTAGVVTNNSAGLLATSTTLAGLTSVTSTTFVGALTGHASSDLALAGGTMAGAIAMGGNNISGGGTLGFTTVNATTLTGALTGHASLDLALTGGTVTGNTSFSSGLFQLTNGTSNLLAYAANGLGGPGTAGEKLQLFSGVPGVPQTSDYAIGVLAGNLWLNSGGGIQFYSTGTLVASISTNGAATTTALVASGSVPTLSGTCSAGTQVGGNTAGTFKASALCAAGTVILTFATTAPNGWVCNAHDQTTPADLVNQTANSATSCTLTGTMANADVVAFDARAF